MRHGVTAAPIVRGASRALHRIDAIVLLGRYLAATGGRWVAATEDRNRMGGGRSVVGIR